MREQRGDAALSLEQAVSGGFIEYIAFPDALRGKYQSYTQADLTALRNTGCDHAFASVQQGVRQYVQTLSAVRP
jgi:ADP-L-glycero-D-manno-heptose 6-epimerase